MFPRRKRVSRDDFPTLLASRRRVFGAHFSATLADEPKGYAVVVSKKVEATSVARHALKRRILGVLKEIETALPAAGIIIFAKKDASKLANPALRAELKELLSLKVR